MKYLILLALTYTLISCSDKTRTGVIDNTKDKKSEFCNHYVEFQLDDQRIIINGKSDINSEFYSKRWPEYHSAKTIKKTRLENQNSFCGRICNKDYSEMIELFYTYPKNKKLKVEDLKKEINKKVSTSNYEMKSYKPKDLYFRLYYFNSKKEYTSDNETDGYIKIESVENITDSTITAKGILDLNIREYGKPELKNIKGKFNLEFYIGI